MLSLLCITGLFPSLFQELLCITGLFPSLFQELNRIQVDYATEQYASFGVVIICADVDSVEAFSDNGLGCGGTSFAVTGRC